MNYFRYRKELYKLNSQRDKEKKSLDKLVDKARKDGGYDAAIEVYQMESVDFHIIDDEISYLKTRHLISKAEKMSLPTPRIADEDGLWEQSSYIGKWYLTNKGITEIRRLIRQERKENFELVSHWVTIIIGVIGAIIGLISVINK